MNDSQKQQTKKRFFKGINRFSGKRSPGKKVFYRKDTKKTPAARSEKKPTVVYENKTAGLDKTEKSGSNFLSVIRKSETDLALLFIPLTLFVVFATIYLLNWGIGLNIQRNKLIPSQAINLAPYPIVQNLYEPIVSAKAAIVLDADSQTILISKNPHLRFSMASTVKIMTALVALDYYQPDSVLTIKALTTEGSGLNLQIGERFYFKDLLYAMLLPSANDAAAAIADNYPGGRAAFVLKMNEKASNFYLTDTHYADPIGLEDDGDYSNVVDIARLGSIAMKNQQFAQVVGTQQKFIYNADYTREYNLLNLNKLLGIDGVNGIKTGTTEGAGEVLVTSSVQKGHTYIIVVMDSQDRFADTQTLLNLISNNVMYVTPSLPSSSN